MWISDNMTSLAFEGEVSKDELINVVQYNTASIIDQIVYLRHAIINSTKGLDITEDELVQVKEILKELEKSKVCLLDAHKKSCKMNNKECHRKYSEMETSSTLEA